MTAAIAILAASVLHAAGSEASRLPSVAVVVVRHEGVSFNEALRLAARLSQALGRAGASVALEPGGALARLGSRNPESCQTPACFAELAGVLQVSALVTLEVGKVLDQLALVATLVDGRDGKRLDERSDAVAPAKLEQALAAFARDLVPAIARLPAPAPPGTDTPREVSLVPNPGEASPAAGGDGRAYHPGVYLAGGATVATGVAAGAVLLWGYLAHQEMLSRCELRTGTAQCSQAVFQSICHPAEADPLSCRTANDRYVASAVLGASSLVLGAVTGYLLATHAPP